MAGIYVPVPAGHARQHGIDTALDHLPGTIPNGSAVTVQAPGAIAGVAIAAAATPGALTIRDGAGRMKAVAGAAADDCAVVSQLGGHARQHGIDTALDHLPGTIPNGSAVTVQAPGVIAGVAIDAAATPGALPIRDGAGRMKAVAGAAADDCAVVSQLGGGSPADGLAWGAPCLIADQFRAGAQPNGAGIRQAQFLTLLANLVNGDQFSLKIAGVTTTLVCGVNFSAGGSITGTMINIAAAIPVSIYALSIKLYLLDAINNGCVITIPGDFLGTAKIWGDAGFAGKCMLLNPALAGREYASIAADRVACPNAEPVGSNFGFQRTAAVLKPGEAHWSRYNEIIKALRDYTANVAWT
jgi:DNA-binding cell septation regulator SpoVG